jgi:hypothetical protein
MRGYSVGPPHAVDTVRVSFSQDPGQPSRPMLMIEPMSLIGKTTINRLSYQIHAAIYRPVSSGGK